ncbi:MAG: type II secretion system protein [Candidatus Dadabacteria bacterium]|nr:MAG: type II secretion system protein [Candidatus Dadabacteria bacterium]
MTDMTPKGEAQAGFTLIELLVVMAILGVLLGLTAQVYAEYRQMAYEHYSEIMIHDAETALAAGKTREELADQSSSYWLWTNSNGTLGGWPNINHVPGLKINPSTRISVGYIPWCESFAASNPACSTQICCVVDIITAYHCKSRVATTRWRWNTGETYEFRWSSAGC